MSCQNPDEINDQSKRNENWAWFVDKGTGKGEWIELSSETTVDKGDYQLFYCNGNLRQKGKLKNGVDCDTIFYFDIDGQQILKSIQQADSSILNLRPDGPFTVHYPTCELKAEGKRLNNQLIDTCIDYFRNGQISMYGIYRNDTSWIEHYYENGQISHKGMSLKGRREGADTIWYDDGIVKEVRFYLNDLLQGKHELYYPSGSPRLVAYNIQGVEEGYFIEYHENGRFAITWNVINGKKDGVYVRYYSNGNVHIKGTSVRGKKNGLWVAYYSNGKVAANTNYQNDIMHGKRECFSSSGNLFYVQDYRNGEEVHSKEIRQLTETEQEKWEEFTDYVKSVNISDRERKRK